MFTLQCFFTNLLLPWLKILKSYFIFYNKFLRVELCKSRKCWRTPVWPSGAQSEWDSLCWCFRRQFCTLGNMWINPAWRERIHITGWATVADDVPAPENSFSLVSLLPPSSFPSHFLSAIFDLHLSPLLQGNTSSLVCSSCAHTAA